MTSSLSYQTLHQTIWPALHRKLHRPTPQVTVLEGVALQQARVHECNGRSRVVFAMMVATKMTGPVFWIAPKWLRETLNPDGMRAFIKPQNFTFITPTRSKDILWVMEETLRSGAVPLVVAQISSLPSLTAVRRLHLAAEHSATAPLALLLTANDGGAPGVESCWRMQPNHRLTSQCWTLSRTRARTAPAKHWAITKTMTGLHKGTKGSTRILALT
ncbi:MAG: hypothetical protein P8M25_18055 [Paracoccaceae bacterium]|nr:hypothetical protein [Paracoccaceae bacterium]